MAVIAETISDLSPDDPRVTRGLFTVTEAAGWLSIPRSTLHDWVDGRRGAPHERPIVLTVPAARGEPAVPFLGLAEGMVLRAFRRGGVPLQRVRDALERLDRDLGLRHALASDRLASDGAELLYDHRARFEPGGDGGLVTVRSGQLVFAPVVRESLRRIQYGRDGWAERLLLPGYSVVSVVVTPHLAGGRPVLERSGIPVENVVGRWLGGESLEELAADLGLDGAEIEDVVRAATRRRAA
ncbi:MAG TPA: DUF433 domain-containing protein [Candidatus Dormibacteraeota bacterium]